MINNLEKMFLYIEDVDEYHVSNSEVIEALRQRKQDSVYKERMRNCLINSVKQKKTSMVREILESMFMEELDQSDIIIFYRELIKDGTLIENNVDRFLCRYEESYSFDPYIK